MTRPSFEACQEATLDWLARAHVQAETTAAELDPEARAGFDSYMRRLSGRCACASPNIARRGFALRDVVEDDWQSMRVYDLQRSAHGQGMGTRAKLFAEIVSQQMLESFAGVEQAPADLIHVTCTGFVSPSPAQRLVQARGWASRVTHAYQMGCYAAFPALRIASGFAATADTPAQTVPRVDVAHTELCSLHLDPAAHTAEQMVVQSLFADGFIRYSVEASPPTQGFQILASSEHILPGTQDAMSWTASDWGMQMTLARDVAASFGDSLRRALSDLFTKARLDWSSQRAQALFAIHPGGPRIINHVRDLLGLRDDQVASSRGVLHDYGNMSSATLPHVWMRMLEDASVASGTLIASLAFGPGLTVACGLFRKL